MWGRKGGLFSFCFLLAVCQNRVNNELDVKAAHQGGGRALDQHWALFLSVGLSSGGSTPRPHLLLNIPCVAAH